MFTYCLFSLSYYDNGAISFQGRTMDIMIMVMLEEVEEEVEAGVIVVVRSLLFSFLPYYSYIWGSFCFYLNET